MILISEQNIPHVHVVNQTTLAKCTRLQSKKQVNTLCSQVI